MPARRKKRKPTYGRATTKAKRRRQESSEDDDETTGAQLSSSSKGKFGRWKYNLQEKLICDKFGDPALVDKYMRRLEPEEFTEKYIKETGLQHPILFKCTPQQIGMKIPKKSFNVNDICKLIGKNREVEVLEVATQRGLKMSLEEFVTYYKSKKEKKEKLYNLLSLEFSMTDLAKVVSGPALLRGIDWAERYWPTNLKARYTDTGINSAPFPKVQNYCLLSVTNCYTDFHIDFGGTSVWYHLMKGEKVFWLCPPTDTNLLMFESWLLSGEAQDETFFGDVCSDCFRVNLVAGDTFFIPSGWIHAVHTPVDSLVFGGNLLHLAATPMQLRVYELETLTKVTKKYRYPYFMQILWYVVQAIVHRATGRLYLDPISPELPTVIEDDKDEESLADQSGASIEVLEMPSKASSASAVESVTPQTKAVLEELDCGSPGRQIDNKFVTAHVDTADVVKSDLPNLLPAAAKASAEAVLGRHSYFKLQPGKTDYETPTKFNTRYLAELSREERGSLFKLHEWLSSKYVSAVSQIGEGIKDPRYLLQDLEKVFWVAEEIATGISDANDFEMFVPDLPVDDSAIEKTVCGVLDSIRDSSTAARRSERQKKLAIFDNAFGGSSNAGQSETEHTAAAVAEGDEFEEFEFIIEQPKIKEQSSKEIRTEEKSVPSAVKTISPEPTKSDNAFDPTKMLVPLGHKPLPTALRKGPIVAESSHAWRHTPSSSVKLSMKKHRHTIDGGNTSTPGGVSFNFADAAFGGQTEVPVNQPKPILKQSDLSDKRRLQAGGSSTATPQNQGRKDDRPAIPTPTTMSFAMPVTTFGGSDLRRPPPSTPSRTTATAFQSSSYSSVDSRRLSADAAVSAVFANLAAGGATGAQESAYLQGYVQAIRSVAQLQQPTTTASASTTTTSISGGGSWQPIKISVSAVSPPSGGADDTVPASTVSPRMGASSIGFATSARSSGQLPSSSSSETQPILPPLVTSGVNRSANSDGGGLEVFDEIAKLTQEIKGVGATTESSTTSTSNYVVTGSDSLDVFDQLAKLTRDLKSLHK